jgi:hypothetical protein
MAPTKPMVVRDSPDCCIHRVRTEPCKTQGKPLEKPNIKIVRKRLSHNNRRAWRGETFFSK